MIELRYGTPVERHTIGKATVIVKRDDLVVPEGSEAPKLGKLRGMLAMLQSTEAEVIGVVDRSSASRGAWGTAWLCRELGRECRAYFTQLGPNQERAIELGARPTLLPERTAEQLYREAEESFKSEALLALFSRSAKKFYMAPDDCHSSYLIDDAEQEVIRTGFRSLDCDNLVIPVGSGGLAIGVLSGFAHLGIAPRVHLHMGGSRRTPEYIAGLIAGAGLMSSFPHIELVCNEFAKMTAQTPPPFPSNVTYEQKAWRYLTNNITEGRVVFWNAGA